MVLALDSNVERKHAESDSTNTAQNVLLGEPKGIRATFFEQKNPSETDKTAEMLDLLLCVSRSCGLQLSELYLILLGFANVSQMKDAFCATAEKEKGIMLGTFCPLRSLLPPRVLEAGAIVFGWLLPKCSVPQTFASVPYFTKGPEELGPSRSLKPKLQEKFNQKGQCTEYMDSVFANASLLLPGVLCALFLWFAGFSPFTSCHHFPDESIGLFVAFHQTSPAIWQTGRGIGSFVFYLQQMIEHFLMQTLPTQMCGKWNILLLNGYNNQLFPFLFQSAVIHLLFVVECRKVNMFFPQF